VATAAGAGRRRTLGLFAAADRGELEQILVSMPLRVWRSDEVTELVNHPNDPVVSAQRPPRPAAGETGTEFFTTFVAAIPDGTPAQVVKDARAGEARRTGELAEHGHLIRLWPLAAWPDGSHALGLWRSQDAAQMRAILDSLPMAPWLIEEITPLVPHPSDPAASGSRPAEAQARRSLAGPAIGSPLSPAPSRASERNCTGCPGRPQAWTLRAAYDVPQGVRRPCRLRIPAILVSVVDGQAADQVNDVIAGADLWWLALSLNPPTDMACLC
jgi:muconolactone delta-isomerase